VGGRYILGVEVCEPLLRNYASSNRLGTGNLRAGAQNFDLMANYYLERQFDDFHIHVSNFDKFTLRETEKIILKLRDYSEAKQTCVEMTDRTAFRPGVKQMD
jgi:hypothetical protein